ncbi:CDP-alcohol phosphatidyltransferase family protein [Micrococcoides hystricis]|uniref:CDP-alcohol phosphatidyltransferase family protein n=1 Tax=Micrococcoides hystricis TaxID=1572761 RepID=A0ABV6PBH0_9MICC
MGAVLLAAAGDSVWTAPPTVAMTALLAGLVLPVLAAWSVLRRSPVFLTSADRFTLGRGVLAGGCATLATLVAGGILPAQSWLIVFLAVPAALLDAVDGWVARRSGTCNAYGARLDMETDAAFLMILSLPAAFVVGPWVLLIGAMRYLFVAASWFRPALSGTLEYSAFRRVVAAIQSIALIGVLVPFVPTWLATVFAGAALSLLLISFSRDIYTLEQSHARQK